MCYVCMVCSEDALQKGLRRIGVFESILRRDNWEKRVEKVVNRKRAWVYTRLSCDGLPGMGSVWHFSTEFIGNIVLVWSEPFFWIVECNRLQRSMSSSGMTWCYNLTTRRQHVSSSRLNQTEDENELVYFYLCYLKCIDLWMPDHVYVWHCVSGCWCRGRECGIEAEITNQTHMKIYYWLSYTLNVLIYFSQAFCEWNEQREITEFTVIVWFSFFFSQHPVSMVMTIYKYT